jgi:hypothetical protein
MADRYQDRPFPADDGYDRSGDPHASARGETDPLAELARLIGQTDPFGNMGRANQRANPQVPPRTSAREQYQPAPPPPELEPEDDGLPPGPPPWLQRANRQDAPQQDYPSAVHPLQRYATPQPEPEYEPAPAYADADHESDPARYDDALYGQLETQEAQHDPAYADDAYGYQDGYGDEEQVPKRRGGMVTVVVVLALAVVGTGAAFAYRTFVGSPRSGQPPIIRADAGPTKIVPAPSDGSAKLPDRMVTGDGAEKIVPREEAPVDVNARSGPRVVFPPLNPNGNPPSAASVAPAGLPPQAGSNGTMPNNEPRKIRTLTVHGDQADGSTAPVGSAPPPLTKPAPAARTAGTPPAAATTRGPPSAANASANAPLSLVPQQGSQPAPAAPEPRTRVTTTSPAQTAPSAGAGTVGHMVQVSSQKSEADAQASFRSLQSKFPAILGSRESVIKRGETPDKGVVYRAQIGPFASSDEAIQFCVSLKTAGGQCFVPRN